MMDPKTIYTLKTGSVLRNDVILCKFGMSL